jgi:hypothetical protein
MATPPEVNGWTAVPVDGAALLGPEGFIAPPAPLLANEIEWPTDPVVTQVQAYARDNLPGPVYNHSMRVFYWGGCLSSPPSASPLPTPPALSPRPPLPFGSLARLPSPAPR